MSIAVYGIVKDKFAIEGADRIESLEVVCGPAGVWRGTAVKNQFGIGDLCEVYLQDALLPADDPRFEFMANKGYRVRMVRLRGVPSECLIMDVSPRTAEKVALVVGADISEATGVTKYEKQLPVSLSGDVYGVFPDYIPKTDEPNFQAVPHLVDALRGNRFYSTIKADGSSGTIYWKNGELHCCSRNYELKEKPGVAIWELVKKYNLKETLRDKAAVLQFEIVGPGIQGNPLGLPSLDLRLFSVYFPNRNEYGSYYDLVSWADKLGLPIVEIIEVDSIFEESWDGEFLRHYAERLYPNHKPAEGVVFRPMSVMRCQNERVSFKVINLLYKD